MCPGAADGSGAGATASAAAIRERLAPEAAALLAPYLEHSGATEQDLAAIAGAGPRPPFLDGFRRAEAVLGPTLLRTVVGRLGWPRLAYGLDVQPLDAVSVDGSFPFVVPRAVARILAECGPAQTWWRRHLVVAHGGEPGIDGPRSADLTVQRFRSYNVAHAQLLDEILAVAPVDPPKVQRIATLLARVVSDFAALFHDASEEARRVVNLFERLRASVEADVARDAATGELSGDTVRRVQAFEDPARLDDVTTLHGLKRYLHQQGLRLAFRLFGSQAAANRTVDLVVTSDREVLRCEQVLKYLEFEPTPTTGGARLPFAVSLLAEALGLQALFGRKLPWVTLLGYGNELQVYVHYRNHPAFIRIDLSPPFRGGLIDLEYFAVSQYELDQHPDLSLQGIQRVLRDLEFDVSKDGLRLKARYDKERAVDLGDVVAKARALFRLLPYLMDVDWAIGDLDYPPAARATIGEAWADFFERWGVLPIPEALSADRRKVVLAVEPDPAGPREIPWSGVERYRDRFTDRPGPGFTEALRAAFERHGLGSVLGARAATEGGTGQRALERSLLTPLRAALDRGELSGTDAGFVVAPASLFRRDHEAERLAALLHGPDAPLAHAIEVARLIRAVERQARFVTTGSVDGYAVQAAVLPTVPRPISLFVLRDDQGTIRVAIASAGGGLHRTRVTADDPWELHDALDPGALAAVLRTWNYLGDAPSTAAQEAAAAVNDVRARFAAPSASPVQHHAPDDWIVPGTQAAPGWAAGFARFGTAALPSDLRGAVLVSQAIRPEDAPALRHAAGIVSTGGGVLSHVGLIALELQKPAVIVEGRWSRAASGAPVLLYRRRQWQQRETTVGRRRVVCQHELRTTEEQLEQGDLVAVDADGGHLVVLGHAPQAIALHQDLFQLAAAAQALASTRSDADVLAGRGALIRATHQLDRLLSRIDRAPLARHAVRELLSFAPAPVAVEGRAARARLLSTLLRNAACAEAARDAAAARVGALHGRLEATRRRVVDEVAALRTPGEILFLRHAVWRMDEMLRDTLAVLGAPERVAESVPPHDVDDACAARLATLAGELATEIERRADVTVERWRLRHLLPSLRHVREALPRLALEPRTAATVARLEGDVARADATSLEALRDRQLLFPTSGGIELRPLVGGKAAHLGEIVRVLGREHVPPWFVVTDAAFRAALALPPTTAGRARPGPARPLSALIGEVMARTDLEPKRQADAIRELWLDATLPDPLADHILAAYRDLAASQGEVPVVAIRSSAAEEDAQEAAWAGQFDTFLFVHGDGAVLEHLKLAWAGFWTERAIFQRRALGMAAEPRGGGVLVQRMVDPRASGVLHTVSAATGQLRQIVVIAGLGVGEGVVSGTVDVDTVLVSKQGDLERTDPRVRYRIGDKREQLVHDTSRGAGTRRVETAYHQRFRAALEYVELKELVRAALRLERAFLSPLDVEFAVDQQGVRILQARPVSLFENARRETIAAQPLPHARTAATKEPS